MDIVIKVVLSEHKINDVIAAFHYALQVAEEKMIEDDFPLAHIIYEMRNNAPVLYEEK